MDRATIRRDRAWNAEHEPNVGALEPQPGNSYALTHGATSEQRIAELEPGMRAVILNMFPWLDDVRLATLAHRMASHQSGSRWLADRAGVVRNADGDVWPVVNLVEKWGRTIERLIAELDAEARERTSKPPSLDAYLADRQEEDADQDAVPESPDEREAA
ncbi:MAG: hypothetical protein ACR2LK_14000 [Solirubrobacteraceae bacterium]